MKKEIAKMFMKLAPSSPMRADLSLNEIFNDTLYTDAESYKQKKIRQQSSQFRYDYEENSINLFDKYYPEINKEEFIGRVN